MTNADAPAYAAGTGDPDVRTFGHLPESEYTAGSVRAMIHEVVEPSLAEGSLAVLSLTDAESDRFVGSMVIFDVSDDSAEVGFWLTPDGRGSGHASRGLALAASFAQASGLCTLTARTVTSNHASQRCLLKAGFVETERRTDVTPSGRRDDLVHYRKRLYPDPQWPLPTDRLQLRPHLDDDAGWLHELHSRPDVARYLLDEPWSPDDAHRKVTERATKTGLGTESGALSVVIENEGSPIGDVSLWLTDREHGQAEIGWVLHPDYGRQGFASEAVNAILALGFDHYRLHRISAQMDDRNSASAALARRVGMRFEAHHLDNWYSKGEWTNTLVYALLAAEPAVPPAGA